MEPESRGFKNTIIEERRGSHEKMEVAASKSLVSVETLVDVSPEVVHCDVFLLAYISWTIWPIC